MKTIVLTKQRLYNIVNELSLDIKEANLDFHFLINPFHSSNAAKDIMVLLCACGMCACVWNVEFFVLHEL